jgi:hypothetical protein
MKLMKNRKSSIFPTGSLPKTGPLKSNSKQIKGLFSFLSNYFLKILQDNLFAVRSTFVIKKKRQKLQSGKESVETARLAAKSLTFKTTKRRYLDLSYTKH